MDTSFGQIVYAEAVLASLLKCLLAATWIKSAQNPESEPSEDLERLLEWAKDLWSVEPGAPSEVVIGGFASFLHP